MKKLENEEGVNSYGASLHPSSVLRFLPQHTWTSMQYDQIRDLTARGAACAGLLYLAQRATA